NLVPSRRRWGWQPGDDMPVQHPSLDDCRLLAAVPALLLLAIASALLLLPPVARADQEPEELIFEETTTVVQCSGVPNQQRDFTCRAVVATGGDRLPSGGQVTFSTNGSGTFNPQTCAPAETSFGRGSCEVGYHVTNPDSPTITAPYGGGVTSNPPFFTLLFPQNPASTSFTVQNPGGVRFAAPDGTGSDPCRNPAAPCSIFTAISPVAPGTSVVPGEQVSLAPGTYFRSEGDFGPFEALSAQDGLSISGQS